MSEIEKKFKFYVILETAWRVDGLDSILLGNPQRNISVHCTRSPEKK